MELHVQKKIMILNEYFTEGINNILQMLQM